jgi:hypothetical protein
MNKCSVVNLTPNIDLTYIVVKTIPSPKERGIQFIYCFRTKLTTFSTCVV